ncbi:hypothetical protein ACMT4L_06635 [Deinococcus sp. A31D244]|uniref:hypothetical protein n=1 Tax=Deinococcus sp. A31D244 TaxID=3397675 RepID=UPI0039DF5941
MTPTTPTRKPVKGFDARRATATLLLLTGSVSAGLTTFWLGGRAQPTAAASSDTNAQYTGDSYASDSYTDDGYTDDDYSTSTGQDGSAGGSTSDWAQAAPQGSTYAAQPQARTRATTRGS